MPKEKLETVNIENVEILAAGTWHGSTGTVTYDEKDLEEIVDSFNKLKGAGDLNYEPPVKLGHADNQKLLQSDGYPAAGWISGLKKVGDKLVATLSSVPKKLARLITAGAYKKVSSEIYPSFEAAGKKFGKTLKAIALLGADIPAVKTIDDIIAQYGETLLDEAGVPFEAVVFEEGTAGEPASDTAEAAVNKIIQNKEDSVEKEKEIRETLGLAEEADILEAVKSLKVQADAAAVKLAEGDELKTRVTRLEEELAKSNQTIALKERDARVEKAITSGKVLPAQKEWANKYALENPEGFDSFVEAAPVVVELGEKGTEGNNSDPELTEAEIRLGEKMGVSREDLINAKKEAK